MPLEKSVRTGQAGSDVSQEHCPSLQRQDLPEPDMMPSYFIDLGGFLLY